MKLNLLRFTALAAIFMMASCNNDDDVQGNDIVLDSDASALNQRISFDNVGVLSMRDDSSSSDRTEQVAGTLPLTLVAEVAPPSYNGRTLKATHVAINGTYAYVSYNIEGEAYGGAIDVINISNPNAPTLMVQAILPNTDVSSVRFDSGVLYIAGARSVDAFPTAGTAAFSGVMPLNGGLVTTTLNQVSLAGNTGTSVTSSSSKYYAVSGNNGSLYQLNKTSNAVEMSIPLADLRAVGFNDNKIVVLSGTQGVKVYNATGLTQIASFPTSQDVQQAKRTIDFLGTTSLLVSEGYNGLGVYNISTGAKTQTIAVPTNVAGVLASDITTNAVSVNSSNVFVANGGAGMYIYKNTNQVLSFLGSIALSGNSSCNYLTSSGDYIFAAMGNGGLKIVKMVTSTVDCTSFPTYTGSTWLNVNSGETKQYQGAAALTGVNVNANLTWCGSLSVSQGINVNSGGVFYMKGSLAQGSVLTPYNSLNVNGTLKIEGSVVVYGNMILNSGAKLEFVGSGSSITIFGSVTKGSNVTITGNYVDTFNKL
ncbi:LVIVD repeat-containing protein [Flavobacterium hauense]